MSFRSASFSTTVRARALVANNSTDSILVPSTPTAAPFTNILLNDSQFNVLNGVITFLEDSQFTSVFYTTLSNLGGAGTVLTFYTDAEVSTDGITWIRGTQSLREEAVRGSDTHATRSFAFSGRFLKGTQLRFVWWASNDNCVVTTDTVSGSTATAIRLTYSCIPATLL